ncbi:MAG TPA: hypothetical protein VM008_12610 [Phycisphaerae bacterium]|nr:hypothetical protein [Phycisphaerae bacterium]
MRSTFVAAAFAVCAFSLFACTGTPVQRVDVPPPSDTKAYQPQPMPKPLPPEGYDPTLQQAPPPGAPGQPVPPPAMPGAMGQPPADGHYQIQNEEAFLQAYAAHRSPRIMVMASRSSLSDPRGDSLGATADDYDLIEASIVEYFDASGKVTVQDADAARAKLNREQILRIENNDPAANRLLSTELQQDIVIHISAKPTQQSSFGHAVRLIAKAVSTTDARTLGTAFADMPLPMSKTNINVATRYLSEQLMGDMARKWSGNPQTDTIEVRVYKTATVDDALKIRKWLQRTPGVTNVINRGATGGSTTAYAAFAVSYNGAPEDLYAGLQEEIGQSQGMKAVDLQNNTVTLEVTGQLNLVTTTQKTETTTTTTVHTTEEKKIEPINPASPPPTQPAQ